MSISFSEKLFDLDRPNFVQFYTLSLEKNLCEIEISILFLKYCRNFYISIYVNIIVLAYIISSKRVSVQFYFRL